MANDTPVPSREAVDLIKRARKAEQRIGNQVWRGDGDSHIFVGLLIGELRAEVERLTDADVKLRLSESARSTAYDERDRFMAERDIARTTVAQLERTVADQAAALAERDKDAERLQWFIAWYLRDGKRAEIDPVGHIRRTTEQIIRDSIDAALAASVSSASEDKP